MIQFAICSMLVGAVFGLRFKVMVIVPLTVVGCFGTLLTGLVIGQSGSAVAISLLIYAVALQAGYLFGSLTRMTMAALRAPRVSQVRSRIKTAQ